MFSKILFTLTVTWMAFVAGQTCYHPDQTSSSDQACGFNTNDCCGPDDTCVTQGLCQDTNNHLNGSLTYLAGAEEPGPYNYTGLYKTASCTNEDWSNCINHCPSSDNNKTAYIWACNDQLTLFCCHDDKVNPVQGDCCGGSTWSISEAPLALNVSLRATTQPSQTTSSASSISVITIFTVAATTTNATSVAQTSATFTSTPSALPFHDTSEGLSTSAKTGLGVGISIGLVGTIALAFFWWRKRRLGKRQDNSAYVGQSQQKAMDSYMPFQPSELETHGVQELYVDSKPIELAPGRNVAHELST